MGSTRFQTVKALAYQLWLEAGCPEGHADEHWAEAERLLTKTMVGAQLTLHVNPSLRGRSVAKQTAEMLAA